MRQQFQLITNLNSGLTFLKKPLKTASLRALKARGNLTKIDIFLNRHATKVARDDEPIKFPEIATD